MEGYNETKAVWGVLLLLLLVMVCVGISTGSKNSHMADSLEKMSEEYVIGDVKELKPLEGGNQLIIFNTSDEIRLTNKVPVKVGETYEFFKRESYTRPIFTDTKPTGNFDYHSLKKVSGKEDLEGSGESEEGKERTSRVLN